MPKKSAALISTDREVHGAKAPQTGRAEYRVAGSAGLVLRVTPDGRRSWVVWLKPHKAGKWRKFTLGTYPLITLARARQDALRHGWARELQRAADAQPAPTAPAPSSTDAPR